jgi:hypothetical protein
MKVMNEGEEQDQPPDLRDHGIEKLRLFCAISILPSLSKASEIVMKDPLPFFTS